MSSPITPLQSAGHSTVTPMAPARVGGSFSTELAASERASAVEVLRAGPPPEVLAQMASAAGVHDQLQQEGRELRFSLPQAHGRVRIELLDSDLGTSSPISVVEALDIAAGKR